MKFGKLLRRQALAKWAHQYVDYKRLKQLLKEPSSSGAGQSATLPSTLFRQSHGEQKAETEQKLREFAHFFRAVVQELDKVCRDV